MADSRVLFLMLTQFINTSDTKHCMCYTVSSDQQKHFSLVHLFIILNVTVLMLETEVSVRELLKYKNHSPRDQAWKLQPVQRLLRTCLSYGIRL